jgi:hypothetical protein
VLTVDDAQIWTVIGVLAAGLFGMLTLMSTLFLRVLRAEIGGLRAEIGGVRTELRADMGSLRSQVSAEIGSLRSEVRADIGSMRTELNARIDGLDRDIQFLMKREADRS